LALLTTGYHH